MQKFLVDLLKTNPELFFGILILGALIFLILVSLLSVKASKAYFENITSNKIKEVEEKILKQFSGYENKILTTLDNIKKQIDFKRTKILLLNDIDDKVNRIFNLCDMRNITHQLNIDDIYDYSSIVVYIKDSSCLQFLQDEFRKLPNDIIKIVYSENNIDRALLPENHVLVNFEYTLIEKLHSIYQVKNIMEK